MTDVRDLRERALAVARRALERGALQPIRTAVEVVAEGGVAFVVRILDGLGRKQVAAAAAGPGPGSDPFLPPEPALVVAEVSPTHLAVLNRFPALEEHLLLVTRAFEEQSAPLGRADFEALLACLADVDGLAFYNGGAAAGASQRHKHLQLVPRALGPGAPQPPVEAVLPAAPGAAGPAAVPALPFRTAFCGLPPGADAAALLERYGALLEHAGVERRGGALAPYNLLATRDWMLLVPRVRDDWEGISVNALGFAGALLARDEAAAARIRAAGPMRVLASVAAAR